MDRETETAAPDDTTLVGIAPDTEISPQPRKRKLRGRHKTKRTLIAAEKRTKLKANNPFFGMTQMNCADGCQPDRCVISEMAYCAHPYKGGLQRVSQNNIAAINRLNNAKEFLGPPKRI
jgi:hypothetical protein